MPVRRPVHGLVLLHLPHPVRLHRVPLLLLLIHVLRRQHHALQCERRVALPEPELDEHVLPVSLVELR